MSLNHKLLCVTMVVAGASAWFVVSTITMDQIPDVSLMAIALVAALAFVSAFAGTASRERMRAATKGQLAFAGAAGILTWLVPGLVVLSQRATDAPSGTETLFFSTAAWALGGAFVALGVKEDRPTLTEVAAVALSVVGSAALLANWERPSSFSPFIKFPAQEAIMVAAGVLFAIGLVMGRRSGKILGSQTSLWLGVASATAAALFLALPVGFGQPETLVRLWPQLLLAGAALATLATGMTALVRVSGPARALGWLVIPPIALTALSVIERLTATFGPSPIVWLGVIGGTLVSAMGLLVLEAYPASEPALAPSRQSGAATLVRIGLALAAAAALLAAIAMILPAFSATVVGTVESGAAFKASWTLSGAESAVGWMVMCVSLLALALSTRSLRIGLDRRMTLAAVATVAALATYPLLVATPLHIWNRWIPAEIQQAYGTEYARLNIEVVPGAVRFAAAGLAFAACVVLIAAAALRQTDNAGTQNPVEKENA